MNPDPSLRLAVALVCDVDQSTDLRIRVGDYLVNRLLEQLQRALRAAVTREGALATASTGDGLWAVLPSASAALAAARGVVHASARLSRRSGIPFTLRAGLAAGDVRFDEHDVRGLAMVQATRLMQAAKAGEVLAAAHVAELARSQALGETDYVVSPAPSLELKGLGEPLRASLVQFAPADTRSEVAVPSWLGGQLSRPFVGRQGELDQLQDILKRSLTGGAEVAVVYGPPGIGKTSLVMEFARSAADRGVAVLGGRCREDGSDPYQPFVEAFERVAAAHPGWLAQVPADALAPELAALTPAFASLPRPIGPYRPLDAHTGQARVHHAVLRLIQALAAIEPLVLLIDDLQWATPSTCQLLDALARQLQVGEDHGGGGERVSSLAGGIAIIATCRSAGFGAATSPELPGGLTDLAAHAPLIELRGLDQDEVERLRSLVHDELVHDDILHDETAEPARTAQALVAATGGNPLLVTELLRADAAGGPAASVSLARFINVELARQGPDAVAVAQCVSVDRGGVEPFAARAATGLAAADFERAAAAVVASGVLAEVQEGVQAGTQLRLAFRHDVVREAVESSVTVNGRAELRAALADALELGVAPGARDVFRLAEHRLAAASGMGRADLVRAAYEACGNAAEAASARAAHLDAAHWFRCTHDMAELLGAEVTIDERVRLTIGEGTSLLSGADARGNDVLEAGLQQCWAGGRADLAAEILLSSSRGFFSETSFPKAERIDALRRAAGELHEGHDALRARLVAELAAELTWHPEGDVRFELSDEALGIAASVRDSTTLAHVLVRRQLTIAAADTLEARREACDELLDIAEQLDDVRLLFDAYFQRSGPAVAEGDIATIRSCLARAQVLADEAAQPQLQWLVSFSQAALLLFSGELAGAAELAEAAVNVGRDANVGFEATAFYREQIAEIRRLQGTLATQVDTYRRTLTRPRIDPVHATLRYGVEAGAVEEAAEVFDALARAGFPIRRDVAQRAATDNLVVVALQLGRLDAAQQLGERLAPFANTFGHGAVAHPCGHHYLGLVAAARGDGAAASGHFAEAAAIHERCGVPLLLAETLVEWRTAALQGGQRDLADDLQRRALEVLAGRGAIYLETRAKEA